MVHNNTVLPVNTPVIRTLYIRKWTSLFFFGSCRPSAPLHLVVRSFMVSELPTCGKPEATIVSPVGLES